MDKILPEVISRIFEGYRMAQTEDVKWTGTTFSQELSLQVGEICELYPIMRQYEVLKSAYPEETELMKTIDKLSVWFIKQEKWTIYQHTKAVFRSMNRILNDYGSDRRMQYLFIILSLEITIEYTNANV